MNNFNSSSNSSNGKAAGGVGFFGLLGIVFIVLKLIGVIHWPWLAVLAPIWVPILLYVLFILLFVGWLTKK